MEFEYKAFDMNGCPIKGVMNAEGVTALINMLKSTGATSIEAVPVRIEQRDKASWRSWVDPKTVTSMEKVVFTRQLSAILQAGVILTEAIETICTDMDNKYFGGILEDILSHIRAGGTFSAALSRHPAVFSVYYVAVIRSGEEIGNLALTMTNLATFMEDYEKMRLKLLAAIRYPVFLVCFVTAIVLGMVLFLIPKFKVIFEGAGIRLPPLTRFVVGISEFFLSNIAGVLIVSAILGVIGWRVLKIFKVRFTVDYYLLRLPIVGRVIHKAMIARLCRTSAMLLKGGVGILPTLSLSGEVVVNLYLKELLSEVRYSVSTGVPLGRAMGLHRDFPRILVKMVMIGEKGGVLPDMIRRMADYYDQEVDTFLGNLNSLLEPVFIILIGAVVTVIAVALYLPIFSLSGTIK